MIKTLLTLLKNTEVRTENVKIALGKNEFPSNFKDFVNYLILR